MEIINAEIGDIPEIIITAPQVEDCTNLNKRKYLATISVDSKEYGVGKLLKLRNPQSDQE